MNAKSQRGFTLWELLTALTIAGIVIGLGVPNFIEFSRTNAMAAAANSILTGLMTARTEAVKRRTPVTVCLGSGNPPVCNPAGTGGYLGFVVWVDTNGDHNLDAGETVLMQRTGPDPKGTLKVWDDVGYITYAASGFPSTANPHVKDILYCDDRGNRTASGGVSSARAIRVAETGRAEVLREIADVTTALNDITAAGVGASCP
jgi:type IV fimbrial biogenesis protein FimT